ncbi:hypothetical protein ACLBXO_24805 [Methylobacterium sp. C33D]
MRVLGLAMHHSLEDEEANANIRWSQLGLDPDNKEILSLLLARIRRQQPHVPYAFNAEGIVFNEDGRLLPPPAGKGLTCATFIIAVLRTYAFELLDLSTWPDTPRDVRQFEFIIRYLRRVAGEEHIAAIKADKGARSINPDEVVAAGSLPYKVWPVDFPTAKQIAESVLRDLKS